MPQISYDLIGVGVQTELGKNGTVLDASRLIERRGQNVGFAPNYVQLPLELPFGSSVDVSVISNQPTLRLTGAVNSTIHWTYTLTVVGDGITI